ncbi:MAG: hypothetical protein PHT69_03160 [Bacteroidales bacterium]|nr:hypothetical protein [Bacteroidales bacterium]
MKYRIFSLLFFILSFYSFSNAQEITQNDGFYYKEGVLFTGIYEQTDEFGYISARLSIKKGLLDGVSEIFENRVLIEKRSFRKGQKHGPWLKFENGILISSAQFLKDRKHGKWSIWDSNGTLRYEMFYKKGKKVGIWKMWNENGVLISEKPY